MQHHPDFIRHVFDDLRREVDSLAKAVPGPEEGRLAYPDPALLGTVERRVLVRSIFSFAEATVFALKMWVLDQSDARGVTADERALALEQSYELTESGEPTTRRARLRFLSNLRFAFRLLSKYIAPDFVLDVSRDGWQALRAAVALRDRLMHPKRVTDLVVTDDEIRGALRGYLWLNGQIVLALISALETSRARLDEIRTVSEHDRR